MKRGNRSFQIALSGISCAVAVIFLSLGIISGIFVATGYMFGILALMVPLAKNFYLGDFLAYIGTCILALIFGAAAGFWDLIPFIMFFGLHPLINALQKKFNINKWLALAVKAVWFDCTLIASYFIVFGGILGGSFLPDEVYRVINDYIYLFIFTLGTVFFVLYDYLILKCQIAVNIIVRKIKK
ncbi:MAG: hypothetical protein J1G05_05435 [Clostridiales bacterium]|nr:hypothetical protein [Clostridiales bacterium]